VDPLTALRQIAFRLERTRASTYRVQAFRTAADVVARMDPKILKARTQAGALHAITGIGEVTGTAITEAVRGEVPTYLRRLEAEQTDPLVELAVCKLTTMRGVAPKLLRRESHRG